MKKPVRINKIPKNKILLGPPFVTIEDEQAIIKVIRSGQLSLGPMIEKFEKNFANFIGSKYAVACSSGTTGLHLAVRMTGIRENDEVITSPFSFVSSANCILYEKAKPVFVDIDPQTLNIDFGKIEKAITKKTKAILPVHIFGYPAELDKIYILAKKYNLTVIEDAAEALGAKFKGKNLGAYGNPTVFAFYPNKQMTTAEGGMITTNSKKEYLLLKSLVNQGRASGDQWLNHQRLGYNYRMNEISAALGLSQLKKINFFLEKRKQAVDHYNRHLKNYDYIELIKNDDQNHTRSWFVYVVKINPKINRDSLIFELQKKGIPSRPYLPPIHLQPYIQKMFNFKKGDFPVCEKISAQTLALPFYTGIEEETINIVCKKLKKAIKSLI